MGAADMWGYEPVTAHVANEVIKKAVRTYQDTSSLKISCKRMQLQILE